MLGEENKNLVCGRGGGYWGGGWTHFWLMGRLPNILPPVRKTLFIGGGTLPTMGSPGYSRTLLAIHQKYQEPSFCEVISSFVLLAYANLATSGTLLQLLLACLNFRFRRFILLVQMKKVISMSFGSSASSWNSWRWVRLDLMQFQQLQQFQPEPTHKIH